MLHITTSEKCHSAFGECVTRQNLRFHIRENTWQCQPSMFSDVTKGKAVLSVPPPCTLGSTLNSRSRSLYQRIGTLVLFSLSYPKIFVYRTRQFFNWEIPINLIRAPNLTRHQMCISADSDKLGRNMCLDKHSELELRHDPISRCSKYQDVQIWKHISHWAVNDETQSSTKPKKTYTTNNHSHENLEISMLILKKTRARL
jgi:hypothetical protein